MKKIFFTNLDILEQMAGVELASLARTKLFEEYLGTQTTFVTCHYNGQLYKNAQRIKSLKRAAPDMAILSMYDYLQETSDIVYQEPFTTMDFTPFRTIDVPNTPDIRLYNDKGEFVAYCKRSEDDHSILFINYLEEGIVTRRESFDCRGFISRIELLEKKNETEEISNELYLRPDGSIALTKRCKIEKGIAIPFSIHLINKVGKLTHLFKTDLELMAYWLELIVKDNSDSVFVIDRCFEYYSPLHEIETRLNQNIKLVPVVGSVHTAGDPLFGSVNPFYKSVVEDIKSPDAVISFTVDQKQDLINRYGEGNIVTIPHSYHYIEHIPAFTQRNRFKVVYLARFAPEKNHDVALNVFRLVVDSIPHAQLHLYGFGDKQAEVLEKIKELNLTDNVFVHNYVNDIGAIYQEAGLSILTSSVEAFCLGVMESLFYSCPVVSFDIKYGPSAMIQNSVNGFLVPLNDTTLFANHIINILNDEKLHQHLVENSALSMKNFTHEHVAKQWGQLLSSL